MALLKGAAYQADDGARRVAMTLTEVTEQLRAHWLPTFTKVNDHFSAQAADGFLDAWGKKWDQPLLAPGDEQIAGFLARPGHSAPGPDGLPYAAWAEAGLDAVVTLREVLRASSRGDTYSDLNDQLAVFVPKDTEDAAPGVREACDTRPLSLNNADVKTVTAVANGPLKRALPSWAAEEQRGFIRGRNFLDNVVDVDSSMRIAGTDWRRRTDLALTGVA